jgi:hypothetical protein
MLNWFTNIFLAFMGIYFLFSSIGEFNEHREIMNNGKIAIVNPLGQYLETTRTTKKLFITTSETKSFKSDISFLDENENMVTIRNRSIPKDVLNKFMGGEVVTIKYLPNNTLNNKFPSEGSGASTFFWMGVAALALLYVLVRFDRKKAEDS